MKLQRFNLCFAFITLTMILITMVGCNNFTSSASQTTTASEPSKQITNSQIDMSSIEDNDLMSDEELVERLLYLFNPYTLPVSWWIGAGESALDYQEFEYVEPIKVTSNGTEFYQVMRFNSIKEMKRATEQVVTEEYAQTYLYPFLEENGQFIEIEGKLYMENTGAGIWPFVAVSATVLSKSEDSAMLSVVFLGPNNEESVRDVDMKKENQTWKLNNTPYVELPNETEK